MAQFVHLVADDHVSDVKGLGVFLGDDALAFAVDVDAPAQAAFSVGLGADAASRAFWAERAA